MKLLRINGDAGAMVYDGDAWKTENAKNHYETLTGVKAYEDIDELLTGFVPASKLVDFLRTGE
jgi:hypothetical protein